MIGIGNNILMKTTGVPIPTGPWVTNTSIISGLGDVGDSSAPTVFYIGADMYLITGEYNIAMKGFKWNGTSWVADTGIISGLTYYTLVSTPTAFYMGADLYLVTGYSNGTFRGHKWNGTSWVLQGTSSGTLYDTIVGGLGDIGSYSSISVMDIGGSYYAITGEQTGAWTGWLWNGTYWVDDTGIIAGIDASGINSSPETFYIGSDLYFIGMESAGFNNFKKWNGSTWISDTNIGLGLITTEPKPITIFYIGESDLYMIGGNASGTFYGYKY